MQPQEYAVQALPQSAPSGAPPLRFPRRASVADLRKLRERHFQEGHHELALQVATEIAMNPPDVEGVLRVGAQNAITFLV